MSDYVRLNQPATTREGAIKWLKREIRFLLPDAGRKQQRLPKPLMDFFAAKIERTSNISSAVWECLRMAKLYFGLPVTGVKTSKQMSLLRQVEKIVANDQLDQPIKRVHPEAWRQTLKDERKAARNGCQQGKALKTPRETPITAETLGSENEDGSPVPTPQKPTNSEIETPITAETVGFSTLNFVEQPIPIKADRPDICGGCGDGFRTKRKGQSFCSSNCRLRTHRAIPHPNQQGEKHGRCTNRKQRSQGSQPK